LVLRVAVGEGRVVKDAGAPILLMVNDKWLMENFRGTRAVFGCYGWVGMVK